MFVASVSVRASASAITRLLDKAIAEAEGGDEEACSSMLSVLAAYVPSVPTSLPAELCFNGLREAERLLKNPAQASMLQAHAVTSKALEHRFCCHEDSFTVGGQ